MRLALVGLCLSVIGLAGCVPSDGDRPANTSVESDLSVLSLEVGSCLNDISQPVAQEMTEIPALSCDEPHQSEVFAEILIDDASYPGVDAVTAFAVEHCEREFEQFVGLPYEQSTLSFHYYYPTQNSWAVGDRSVFCVAYDPSGDTEGSLADSQR
jgi:hypothetical protein